MANFGIAYFPMDCHYDDDKIPLIEAEHGLEGFAIIVKLFQKIYGSFGYYCVWNDRAEILFAKSCGVAPDAVKSVLTTAMNEMIFDKNMYEKYGILTSHGIQKRFMTIAKRRRAIFDKPEYVLLSPEELSPEARNSLSKENQFSQNDHNCMHDVCNQSTSKVKQTEEKQREEKKTEVKQSEAKQSTSPAAAAACTQDLLIEKYGAYAVGEYEERFRKWKNKQGNVRVDMYQTIAKWLEQDRVTKPLSSIDQNDILRELREQYGADPCPPE